MLMSAPRLVLLDEPTAGVNPVMIETMERHIRERHAAGITFLIVEHDMTFVMRLCDPVDRARPGQRDLRRQSARGAAQPTASSTPTWGADR